jgi:uncharacterized protein (TIGR01244 family)
MNNLIPAPTSAPFRPMSAQRPSRRSRPLAWTALVTAALLHGCAGTRPHSGSTAQAGSNPAGTSDARPTTAPAVAATASAPASNAPRAIGVAQRVPDSVLAAEFNNLSQDGDIYFAGWPSEAGLRALAARGVRTVIALKSLDEIRDARGYDARAMAESLGINLVVLPVRADSFGIADVRAFSAAFEAANGPVLIHCGSSNTVGGVWAAYLASSRGMSTDKALEFGRAAGLREGPMGDATERVLGEIKAP